MERAGYNNITPSGLKRRLDAGDRPVLLDVREPWEFELARIEGSTFIPMSELEDVSPSSTLPPRPLSSATTETAAPT